MKHSVSRQLEDFRTDTLPHSKRIGVEDLDRWFERTERFEIDSNRRQPDLSAHHGTKSALPYQQEVIAGAVDLLRNRHSGLVSLPTGAGKTFCAVNICLELLSCNFPTVLWLAPQRVLLDQAINELNRIWWSAPRSFDLNIGKEGVFLHFSHDVLSRQFIVSTLQSALRHLGDKFLAHCPAGVAVIDECHYLEANRFGSVVSRLKSSGWEVLGLTATPGRSKDTELVDLIRLFDGNLVTPPSLAEDPVATLVREGVYASIEYQRLVPTFELDTERVARNRGFGESRARTFALSPGRLDRVLDFISDELSTEDHTLVFCLTLGHCHVVAAGLNAAGVTVGLVGSDFSVRHNQRVLKQFMQGEVRVLVNAKYAAVGVDLPNANVAIICTPIGSPIFFEQVIGRIARGPAVGGTKSAKLLDFDNHPHIHGGVKSYARFARFWG